MKAKKKLKMKAIKSEPRSRLEIIEEENEDGYTGKWANILKDDIVEFPFNPEKKKVDIIDNEEDLKILADYMMGIPAFSFDTETNTLDVCADSKHFRCADITISWGENNNYDIVVGKLREEDIDRNIDLDILVKYMKPVFEREDVLIIGANLKYDMHVMNRLGIHIRTKKLFDVELASWICDENEYIGLKPNSSRLMKVSQTKFKETTDSIPKEIKKQFGYSPNAKVNDFCLVSIEDGYNYCTDDSFYTWCLYLGFRDYIVHEGMDKIFYKRMIPFMLVLLEMEERGVSVDKEKLEQMRDDMAKDLDLLQYDIYELAGVEFNIGSPQQKCEILYGTVKEDKPIDKNKVSKALQKVIDDYKDKKYDREEFERRLGKQNVYIDDKGRFWRKQNVNYDLVNASFKFPILAYTETGAPSTDKNTLLRLTQQEYKSKRKKDGIELCKKMLDYSKLEKLKTAFADSILEKMELYDDGKCHPNFRQTGTDSGRISCIEENQLIKCVGEDKPIKDVKVGDLVYCYDDEGNVRVRKVLRVIDNGVRPCVELKYSSQGTHSKGSLICTPDHKIRLVDGSWVNAEDTLECKVTNLRRSIGVIITGVEYVGDRHVYDLEVKDYHNFIASEICVHNCASPNLQQLPKADEEDKYQMRSVFIGSEYFVTDNDFICDTEEEAKDLCFSKYEKKRKKILAIDYHNLEMVCLTYYSHDKNLSEMFANDDDAHGSTAVNMFGLPCTPVECKKEYPHLRQAAKTINFIDQKAVA